MNKNHYYFIQDSEVFEWLDIIKNKYTQKNKIIEKLREDIDILKKETYKDEKLNQMKNELEKMKEEYYRGFPISKEKKEQINQWKINHENAYHGGYPCYHGAAGGGYTYEFYPTGIGVFGNCICGSCKSKAFNEAKGDNEIYRKLLKQYDAVFNFQQDV